MKQSKMLPLAYIDFGISFEDAMSALRESVEWEQISKSLGLDNRPPPSADRPNRNAFRHGNHDTGPAAFKNPPSYRRGKNGNGDTHEY